MYRMDPSRNVKKLIEWKTRKPEAGEYQGKDEQDSMESNLRLIEMK